MFFDNWMSLVRTGVVGVCAYVLLVLLLRVSGKRTLSKLNAFDLVVTVALGSTLATVLLTKNVTLADGVLAFALLIFLQWALAWLSARSSTVSRMVKDEPRLLFHRGQFLHAALKAERVTEGEILQALRTQGIASPDQVGAVVLETDGSFSVLQNIDTGGASSLAGVRGSEHETSTAA
ncbi:MULTISPECIES: DUF421 domain-containing protein [Methylocaldum]|jgi:uncharacterized membrane protein YcaP (DUF421 family)|uniref:DUF421 domain-containing protein n=1 Tax=unclassified Methylocaldum TaxID=2622260 RepID=UPI00098AB016|nr:MULTISPECIES: YetF domain-containing protein [unclassified Methylocaldum]MBP1152993.1 uncharacterized membrane protein YcaP (DUF421 family) [Methylocaldum sp. RMAD-M]MDV3242281.1 DUF421 domain-containing protein [Methylocaldum sp.]MVF21216.1 DUF421 domain-containing protein [Methylocaldum sp. BRCS4]